MKLKKNHNFNLFTDKKLMDINFKNILRGLGLFLKVPKC